MKSETLVTGAIAASKPETGAALTKILPDGAWSRNYPLSAGLAGERFLANAFAKWWQALMLTGDRKIGWRLNDAKPVGEERRSGTSPVA
jgi:hypothetical protein